MVVVVVVVVVAAAAAMVVAAARVAATVVVPGHRLPAEGLDGAARTRRETKGEAWVAVVVVRGHGARNRTTQGQWPLSGRSEHDLGAVSGRGAESAQAAASAEAVAESPAPGQQGGAGSLEGVCQLTNRLRQRLVQQRRAVSGRNACHEIADLQARRGDRAQDMTTQDPPRSLRPRERGALCLHLSTTSSLSAVERGLQLHTMKPLTWR